jgi:acetate kinase
MQELDLSPQELEQLLNHKSGVFGLVGKQLERETFLKAADDGDPRCRLALEIESYRIRKYIGSYLAVAGPADALVFSTGSGAAEWLGREMVLEGLEGLGIRLDRDRNRAARSGLAETEITGDSSKMRTFVVPTHQEQVCVEDVVSIATGGKNHLNYDYAFANQDFIPFI